MSTNTKRRFHYEVEHCDLLIEIDTTVLTAEMARDINEFRTYAQDRLETCDGDVYRVVGRLFAIGAIRYMQQIGGACIQGEPVGTEFVKAILEDLSEGWPPLSELGIRILDAYVPSMDFDDMDEDEVMGETA